MLQAEVTERLLDRLEDCRRSFPAAAVLGGACDAVARRLRGGRAGIERLLVLDSSPAMLARVRAQHDEQQVRLHACMCMHARLFAGGQGILLHLLEGLGMLMDVVRCLHAAVVMHGEKGAEGYCCGACVRVLQGQAQGAGSGRQPELSCIEADEEALPLREHSLDCESLSIIVTPYVLCFLAGECSP
jgi:hypothetical protein